MASLAFVFPGQGSQSVGMLADAYATFPEVAATFDEASEALGYDVWKLVCEGPAEALALTERTQPIILTASVGLYRAWIAQGGSVPAVVAGHSLGEFSALVAAGSLSFADAVRLVRRRGQAMQIAVPVGEGAMAAIIGLADNVINDICTRVSHGPDTHHVSAVNYNSPGQVVIAGHVEAVGDAIIELKTAGAKRALPLPVSAPFHTPLMISAGEVLAEALSEISVHSSKIPVVSNVNAQLHTNAEDIKVLLVKQIASPVLWTQCVQSMLAFGSNTFVECGPGKVLSGLIRRVDKQTQCHSIGSPEDLNAALETLQ